MQRPRSHSRVRGCDTVSLRFCPLTILLLGTAIYFYSSLWPFRVTTSLTLDNEDPFIVDLRDHHARFIKDGPETTQSDVVWYQLNLENKEHTLLISVASGEDLAVVDALV